MGLPWGLGSEGERPPGKSETSWARANDGVGGGVQEQMLQTVNLRFSCLSRTYGEDSRPAIFIEQEVDILAGQVTFILGYSASGKSTLLNQLALIDSPDSGEIFVRDGNELKNVSQMSLEACTDIRLRKFGFVFQEGHLISHFSVRENVALPLFLNNHGRERIAERATELLEIAYPSTEVHDATGERRDNGVARRPRNDAADQYPETLSGGQYIRAAVVRGFAHDPDVLFADEPTGSLDPITGERILRSLLDDWFSFRRHEKSLIIVTHDYLQAFEHADRILVLADGRICMDVRETGDGVFEGMASHHGSGEAFFDVVREEPLSIRDNHELLKRVEALSGKLSPSQRSQVVPNAKDVDRDAGPESDAASSLKFSLKYALDELRFNTRLTIMNVLTIGLLVFSALVVGGVLSGAEQQIEEQLTRDPLLKRLVLYASSSTPDGKQSAARIRPEHVDQVMSLSLDGLGNMYFRKSSSAKKGKPEWLRGDVVDVAVPMGDPMMNFVKADQTVVHAMPGRTMTPDHPLLGSLELKHVRGNLFDETFIDSEGRGFPFGIIMSRSFLFDVLGFEEMPPEEIDIKYTGRSVPLRLLAVAEEVPGGSYIVTDKLGYVHERRIWVPFDLYSEVLVGPFTMEKIDANFARMKRLGKAVSADYRVDLLINRVGKTDDEAYYRVAIDSTDPNDYWDRRQFAEALSPRLAYLFSARSQPKLVFGDPRERAQVKTANLDQEVSNQITLALEIYFHDIEGIIKAPAILRELPLGIETGNIVFVRQLITMKSFGNLIFWVVFVLVAVVAAVNISLSFYQVIQRKVPQIGILRAFGASGRRIVWFYILEALALWFLALVVGGSMAAATGPAAGGYLAANFDIPNLEGIFLLEPRLIGLVAGVSFLICLLGTFWAVYQTIRTTTPAIAVRHQG